MECVFLIRRGFNSSFQAVRPLCTSGGFTQSVSTEEGEERIGKRRAGGCVVVLGRRRSESKETAPGYQANEQPRFPSLIAI